MSKRHSIDAPADTEALQGIEHLSDRSELTVHYPVAKKEWADKELLSDSERSQRRDAEQQAITTSAWREFIVLGLLVPTPYAVLLILLYIGSKTVEPGTIPQQIIPIFLAACLWLGVSYLAIRKTKDTLYDHALAMLPIYLTVFVLTALTIKPIYRLASLAGVGEFLTYLLAAAGVYLASTVCSAVVLRTWTAPGLSNRLRVVLLLATAAALLIFAVLV